MAEQEPVTVEQVTAMDEDIAHRIICEFRPDGWPAKEAETARLIARARLAATRAAEERVEALANALLDPVVVHTNMLKGTIAMPEPASIWHIYGAKALLAAMPAEARATLAEAGGRHG